MDALMVKIIGGVGAFLLLVGAYAYHKHAVSSAYAHGKADEAEHVKAQALAIKAAADALSSNISTLIRSQNDAENSRIHGDADALRLRSPGRAECTSVAGVPAVPSGPEQAGGAAGTAVDRVSYPEWEPLLAMPSAPTITGAEHADLNRAEVLAWREWYKRQSDAWPKPAAPKKKRKLWPFR